MSRHFLYEVEENSLRSKLNNNSEPLNEEAWQKFEQFLSCQKQLPSPKSWTRLNLNINKAYILPGVFAAMILLFSLLLYNFMSIRLPDKTAFKKKQSVLSPKVSQTAVLQPNKSKAATAIKIESTLKAETTENSLTFSRVQMVGENVSDKKGQINSETNNSMLTFVAAKHERKSKKTIQTKKDTLVATEMLPDIKPVYNNSEAELPPPENVPD